VDTFYEKIALINYEHLDIKPFADYSNITAIKMDKILVTTGLSELQNAKIDALGIRNDFKEIHIDDPRSNPRIGKYGIFKNIIHSTGLDPKEIWVIGDNPDSEIKAANQLGIKTIQRNSKSKNKSEYANYHIDSFDLLAAILQA